MLNDLATILIPYSNGIKINTNDRVDEICILLIDLPTSPYIAHGVHTGKQTALIEISVFNTHQLAQEMIQDIFNGLSKNYFETDLYCYQFMYPDTTPSNREIENGDVWQYYFNVVCNITKK